MSSSNSNRLEFCGIPITQGCTSEYLELIRAKSETSQATVFHLVNAYTCTIFGYQKQNNPLLHPNSVNFIDGYWLRRHLEMKTRNQIRGSRGPSLFERSFHPDLPAGKRHLLLGSTPENLLLLESLLSTKSHNCADIQSLSLPFGQISADVLTQVSDVVSQFKPQVVWLSLGTPKQDFAAQQLSALITAPIVCVGAAFDFIAGTKKTAPSWMQKSGLEWLFRLASEPSRLWKRYLIGNVKFMILAVRDRRGK